MRKIYGSEEDLCFQIANYLNYKYPKVIYHFDFGSGTKLTMGQAVKQKRLNHRAWLDLFIAEPRNGYHGLFIEVKRASSNPFKLDGTLKTDKHLFEQNNTLEGLCRRNYLAVFGVGFDQTISIIDNYLQS